MANSGRSGDCSSCDKPFENGDYCLLCNGFCERSYHLKCLETFTKEDFDYITKLGNKVKWFCTSCENRLDFVLKHKSSFDLNNEVNISKVVLPQRIIAGKRAGGGYTKVPVCTLSAELAAVVGQEQMARHEVVKKIWSVIREKNLYDPENKHYAICNDELLKVFRVKRFRIFGMMKFLKDHFVD